MSYRYPDNAELVDAEFEKAISQGRLSRDESSPLWVGHYMFMGIDGTGAAQFKHRDTRKYLPPPGEWVTFSVGRRTYRARQTS